MFPPPCRVNLQDHIFLRKINRLLVLYLCFPMLNFLKLMYSQNNETGILEVLKIKIFFAAQSWWAEFLRIFLKLFLWILRFGGDISTSFLKTEKK